MANEHWQMLAGALIGGSLGKILSTYIVEEGESCLPFVLAGAGSGVLIASQMPSRAPSPTVLALTNGKAKVSSEAKKVLDEINPDVLFKPLKSGDMRIGEVGPVPGQVDLWG